MEIKHTWAGGGLPGGVGVTIPVQSRHREVLHSEASNLSKWLHLVVLGLLSYKMDKVGSRGHGKLSGGCGNPLIGDQAACPDTWEQKGSPA